MFTRQQMNEYLLRRTEQEIQDMPDIDERLFWAYRDWVLELIKAGKDQLASKPTSTQGGEGGQQGGAGGSRPAPTAQGGEQGGKQV